MERATPLPFTAAKITKNSLKRAEIFIFFYQQRAKSIILKAHKL